MYICLLPSPYLWMGSLNRYEWARLPTVGFEGLLERGFQSSERQAPRSDDIIWGLPPPPHVRDPHSLSLSPLAVVPPSPLFANNKKSLLISLKMCNVFRHFASLIQRFEGFLIYIIICVIIGCGVAAVWKLKIYVFHSSQKFPFWVQRTV
jgi:hypothetical protein